MKRIYTALVILFVSMQLTSGQYQQSRIEAFRSEIMPKYKTYFASAEMTDGGQLKLLATQDFFLLPDHEKKSVMQNVTQFWQEVLVVVHHETRRELWGWNTETGNALMIDRWDINPEPETVKTMTTQSMVAKHPWFFYIGSAAQMDSFKNINGALSGRVGFFLLTNKWDLAATLSEQISGNYESSEDISMITSVGLMSKVYYPIRKYNISPNAGAELAVSIPSGGEMTFTPSFILGISWFVGAGSLDAGIRVGSSSSLMLGYTIIPRLKTRK